MPHVRMCNILKFTQISLVVLIAAAAAAAFI